MKQALVTGGSGEIGQAICRQLATDGLHVLVHAHQNLAKAEQIVEEIELNGGSAQALCFDVTDVDQTTQVLTPLIAQAPIQVFVHAAGICQDAPLAGMEKSQWDQVLAVSLNGFYHVTQAVLLPMMSTRWGRVIALSSIAGVMGNRGQANYAAAKAGLHGACKSLSLELASRNITVNAVAPGIIQSAMVAEHFPPERVAQLVPMKRLGRPDEVASLVAFLASNDAAYISGQVISINGGMA